MPALQTKPRVKTATKPSAQAAANESHARLGCVFPSELGWMLATFANDRLESLRLGYHTAADALRFATTMCTAGDDLEPGCQKIVTLLQGYAAGENADLNQIPVLFAEHTEFQRAVLEKCRRIPRGSTVSYGELAAQAGFPGAARAVGSVMRSNRLPLVIPCHRVLGSTGIGGYSAPDGLTLKRRLLMLEGIALTRRA